MGTFALNTSGQYLYPTVTNVWFGGSLITRLTGGAPGSSPANLVLVTRDRLGSDLENNTYYYPYGEEISSTANGVEKFGTYFRDSFTTLDYADQRYYASAYGRFNTADPYGKSARPTNPGSWNRYAYVGSDPVNRRDPRGLCVEDSQGDFWDTGDDVLVDWGTGDCEQNPEWISMANGADPGTVMLNGGLFLPGGGSVSVSETPDPVPCVSSFATSIDCSNPVDNEPVGNLQFISGVASGTAGFNGFLGIFAGGSATVGTVGALAPLVPGAIAHLSKGLASTLLAQETAIGGVSIAALEGAMRGGGGPTTYVVTQLSQAPQWGQSLYVATGDNAMAIAQQYGTGGQFFEANIPTALLNLLTQAGLAWPGLLPEGSQIQFGSGAGAFISNFFSAVQ